MQAHHSIVIRRNARLQVQRLAINRQSAFKTDAYAAQRPARLAGYRAAKRCLAGEHLGGGYAGAPRHGELALADAQGEVGFNHV